MTYKQVFITFMLQAKKFNKVLDIKKLCISGFSEFFLRNLRDIKKFNKLEIIIANIAQQAKLPRLHYDADSWPSID